MEIKGKVIIVTGASSGIGEAVVKQLSAAGAKVVLAARSADKLKELEQELPGSIAVPTDMRDAGQIKNLIDKTIDKFGRVDILINDAGQGMYGPVEKIDVEKYKQVMELNVYGVLRAMQAAIPGMRKQGGGMILNISSRVSKNYFPELAAYASTKYALNALSLTARSELEKDHIIVGVFHPRMTDTNFGQNSISRRPDWVQNAALDRSRLPIDSPQDVAAKIIGQIRSEQAEESM